MSSTFELLIEQVGSDLDERFLEPVAYLNTNNIEVVRVRRNRKRGVVLGEQHTFRSELEVQEFCAKNYLDEPTIHEDGKVSAWCEYRCERLQIGSLI